MKSQIALTTNGFQRFYKFENEKDFDQWEQSIFYNWAKQYNEKVDKYLKELLEIYFDKILVENDLFYETACIEVYCGDDFKHINGFLCGEENLGNGKSVTEKLRYIAGLEKCFQSAPITDRNLICYRSMDEKETEFYKHNTFISKYLSVSGTLESLSNGFDTKTAYTILVPEGTRILCPNMIKPVIGPGKAIERHEAELILPRCMTIKKRFGNYNLTNTRYTRYSQY
jgi:hypothetical protein